MLNRTIAIPIAEIIDGGTKQAFYADLRATLDLSRQAANKSMSLCFGSDVDLMTGGKCPKLYTYPMVSAAFPGVAIAASSISRAVETQYRQKRWEISVGRASVPSFRNWPWPLLCNKSHQTLAIEDEGEYLTARIKLLSGWWTVRLAGGSSHRDQVKGIRNAIEIGKIGDSKIWTDRKHKAVIGVSVSLPEVPSRSLSGTLTVQTMRDEFVIASKQRTSTPFTVSGVKVRKWIKERDRRYQKLRQDRKSGTARKKISKQLREVGDKWQRRLDSFTHEVSAQVVNHAKRRKVKTLKLDMTIKSYMPSFPYFEFASKIKYKCEDAGIEFVNATQTVAQPDADKPHVYFKFSPSTNRVKIGKTSRTDGGRHGSETDSPEELVILAVDNQPKTKLTAREKHHHSVFSKHRVKGEWFSAEPVIAWLREVGWLGNSGNLSQIRQVMEA